MDDAIEFVVPANRVVGAFPPPPPKRLYPNIVGYYYWF